MSVLLI